jgi:UDP:flavonoid glycosyltransferase YjiC (YdhE family)
MKNARNILVVTLEGGGNIPPVLGLAKELAALGNTVTVLSEPCLENTVRNANLNFIAFTDYFTRKSRTEDIFRDSSRPLYSSLRQWNMSCLGRLKRWLIKPILP